MQLFMAQNYQAKNLAPKTAKGDFLTKFSWKLCFKKYETFKSNINISYLCFLQRWFKLYRYSSGILPQNYLTNSFAPENGCSWFIPSFPFGEFDYFHGAFAVSSRESCSFHHLYLPQVLRLHGAHPNAPNVHQARELGRQKVWPPKNST